MNVHFQASRYWSAAEDTLVVEMRRRGDALGEIARAVRRSKGAVAVRLTKRLGVLKRPPPLQVCTVRLGIIKAELPQYYVEGWRVVSFDGDTVLIEKKGPRIPRIGSPPRDH